MCQGERWETIQKFQRGDSEYRLLVVNVAVASSGIDLDDKEGGYPRVMYVSPMYNPLTLHQLGHRVMRMNTRSDAAMYMVYGGDRGLDEGMLNTLARKALVMKETTREQEQILFPGEYERYVEVVI